MRKKNNMKRGGRVVESTDHLDCDGELEMSDTGVSCSKCGYKSGAGVYHSRNYGA